MPEKNKSDAENGLTAAWRAEERRKTISRIIRWSIGIPFLCAYWFLGPIGLGLVVLGAILITIDVSSFVAGLFMNLVSPSRPAEQRPMYGIPESLMARGLYGEAEQEYEKIIQEYPGEVKPHVDMINIAIVRMNDEKLAEELFRRGMKLLRSEAGRQTLSDSYKNIISRLKTPENTTVTSISLEQVESAKERMAKDREKMWR